MFSDHGSTDSIERYLTERVVHTVRPSVPSSTHNSQLPTWHLPDSVPGAGAGWHCAAQSVFPHRPNQWQPAAFYSQRHHFAGWHSVQRTGKWMVYEKSRAGFTECCSCVCIDFFMRKIKVNLSAEKLKGTDSWMVMNFSSRNEALKISFI